MDDRGLSLLTPIAAFHFSSAIQAFASASRSKGETVRRASSGPLTSTPKLLSRRQMILYVFADMAPVWTGQVG